jgi:hypothetical protein
MASVPRMMDAKRMIDEEVADRVNMRVVLCRGFLDLSGSVAHELSAFFVEGGKRRRA